MKAGHARTATAAGSIARGNLREQVSKRILAGVFQGDFRSGQRLVVKGLAALYRVSPTPVRESLVELAGLGIVDLLPNRGAIVRPFGSREIREISQIRRVLEVEATSCARGRIDARELAELERELSRLSASAHDEGWDLEVRTLDTRLHGLIGRSCGSGRLESEIHRYLTLFRTLRDVSHARDAWTSYSRSNDVPEHLAIVRALRADDAELAALSMDRHIRSAARNLEEVVFDSPREPEAASPEADAGPRSSAPAAPMPPNRPWKPRR